jgi:hypothetical protein
MSVCSSDTTKLQQDLIQSTSTLHYLVQWVDIHTKSNFPLCLSTNWNIHYIFRSRLRRGYCCNLWWLTICIIFFTRSRRPLKLHNIFTRSRTPLISTGTAHCAITKEQPCFSFPCSPLSQLPASMLKELYTTIPSLSTPLVATLLSVVPLVVLVLLLRLVVVVSTHATLPRSCSASPSKNFHAKISSTCRGNGVYVRCNKIWFLWEKRLIIKNIVGPYNINNYKYMDN